ncbi:MAG: SsrA-binding protein SmpB [Erysipelotrichaceae bacterium]|nr:SsrA-binding protein SmpB [Erysipelotrichaceae bacterium]MDY5252829.1 SsrA-binding protein SmpB [Erysipelotrichaceae bacterium]
MSEKIISINRKASYNYYLVERFEAGLVLKGTEIKAIRQGKVQFKDAYISIIKHEAFIKEMHIAAYEYGNIFNHDETRERKLLLHKQEIMKLEQKVKLKGFTIVPVKLYLKDGKAKMEIALAKGKELYDKRQDAKIKDAKREMAKALKLR